MAEAAPTFAPAALRTRRRLFRGLVILILIGIVGYLIFFTVVRQQVRRTYISALRSGDGEAAKRAAWWVADFDRLEQAPVVRAALARPDISDDFRESLIYTLGRLADRESAPVLRVQLERSENGFIRQAAWVALARVDADAFRAAVAQISSRDDWDALGISQGRMHLGDADGVGEVLRLAAEGDQNQRQIACRSLGRVVRPVLETAGRWPAEFDPRPGDIWDKADVARVAQRIAEVDLAAVTRDTEQHVRAAAGVQKNVRRLASGRDHLARLLFWRARAAAAANDR